MHLGGQVGRGGPRVYPPVQPRGLGESSLGNHSCFSSRDRDAGQEEMACGELGLHPSVRHPVLKPEGPGLLTQSPPSALTSTAGWGPQAPLPQLGCRSETLTPPARGHQAQPRSHHQHSQVSQAGGPCTELWFW